MKKATLDKHALNAASSSRRSFSTGTIVERHFGRGCPAPVGEGEVGRCFLGAWGKAGHKQIPVAQLAFRKHYRPCSRGSERIVVADISGSADQTGPGRGSARVGEGPTKFRDGGDTPGIRGQICGVFNTSANLIVMAERMTFEQSCAVLRHEGWIDSTECPKMPLPPPRYDDDDEFGVSFFRTRVAGARFEGLTIPRLFVARSEIADSSFKNCDLSEWWATPSPAQFAPKLGHCFLRRRDPSPEQICQLKPHRRLLI